MLTRRHLRVKVLQALYAFFQSGGNDLTVGEKQLIHSTDKLYELYIHQLSFLVRFTDFIRNRQEEARKKFYPTDEDLNPNTRLIDNRIIAQIDQNRNYRKWYDKLRINWADEVNMFLKLYNELKSDPDYQHLTHSGKTGYADDKELLQFIVLKHLPDYEPLRNYFEDRNIFWAEEDYDISLMMVSRTINLSRESWGTETQLPPLFKPDEDPDEDDDRKYMLKLFRYTVLRSEENEKMVEEQADNWELERIAVMDMIILKMALTELTVFSYIPVKVTINEYIEISKYYSSVKSKLFINGIIDKLVAKLKEEGKIRKMGRGLIE